MRPASERMIDPRQLQAPADNPWITGAELEALGFRLAAWYKPRTAETLYYHGRPYIGLQVMLYNDSVTRPCVSLGSSVFWGVREAEDLARLIELLGRPPAGG